ncbi:hypothetical protein D3C83_153560 [compost metagenome]
MVDHRLARSARWSRWRSDMAKCLLILALGAIVLLFGLAIFLPLLRVLHSLS